MPSPKNGRPRICPEQEVALERYTLRVSFKEARTARLIGGGNFSEGLRIALARAAADIEFMDGLRKKKEDAD